MLTLDLSIGLRTGDSKRTWKSSKLVPTFSLSLLLHFESVLWNYRKTYVWRHCCTRLTSLQLHTIFFIFATIQNVSSSLLVNKYLSRPWCNNKTKCSSTVNFRGEPMNKLFMLQCAQVINMQLFFKSCIHKLKWMKNEWRKWSEFSSLSIVLSMVFANSTNRD